MKRNPIFNLPNFGWSLLLLIPLGVLAIHWLGRVPVSSDQTVMFAPHHAIAARNPFALWNPYAGCGTDLSGDLQFAAAYPPGWLFRLGFDWRYVESPYLLLHFAIAAAGALLMLRSMRFGGGASAGGALLYAFGGHLAARAINPLLLVASAWLPWVAAGIMLPGAAGGFVTAVGIGLLLLSGSPHLAAASALTFAACWIIRGPDKRGWLRGGRAARIADAALGLGIGAAALLPGLQTAATSSRSMTDPLRNLAASVYPLDTPGVLFGGTGGAVFPEVIDATTYIGGLGLLLIVVALAAPGALRDRRIWLGLFLFITGIVVSYGKYVGLQYVQPWIPVVRWIEGPMRALVLTALGSAILAAAGFESLGSIGSRRRVLAALATAAATAALLFTLRNVPGPPPALAIRLWLAGSGGLLGGAFTRWDLLITASLGIVLLLIPCPPAIRMKVVAAALMLELLSFSRRVAPEVESVACYDAPTSVERVRRMAAAESAAPRRVLAFDPLQYRDIDLFMENLKEMMTPNLSTIWGIEDIRIFDPLLPGDLVEKALPLGGRAAFNDPLRHFDPDRPDPALMREFNIGWLIGYPGDRRLTIQPTMLSSKKPEASSPLAPETVTPMDAWLAVSLIDGPSPPEPGQAAATLEIDAEEGAFTFPLRRGIETDTMTLAKDNRTTTAAPLNMTWWQWTAPGDKVTHHNYRALIPFGRTLHVRSAKWRLEGSDYIVFIAAQGCRLAGADDPNLWKPIVPGSLYEFLEAAPRGEVRPGGTAVRLEASANRSVWKVRADAAGTFLLRERWAPGWTARVGGKRAEVVKADGLWRSVPIPEGESVVQFTYRPMVFLGSAALSLASFLGALALFAFRRRSPARE